METVTILGTKITVVENYERTYNRLMSVNGVPCHITINNVHTIVESVSDKKYKEIINSSFLSLPDGKPLSVVAKMRGEKNISRIFGPTLFEKTLEWGQKDDLKHFFFGSSKKTLNKMKEVINSKYPEAIICGMVSPPYRQFTDEENERFLEDMNNANADLIWVGLGAPKQEIWMYENYKKLNRGIMIGIGAGFDYLAGNTKHAPEWMKNFALEWLYRLLQEPRRLWKRYLITNTLFIWYLFLDSTGLRKFEE